MAEQLRLSRVYILSAWEPVEEIRDPEVERAGPPALHPSGPAAGSSESPPVAAPPESPRGLLPGGASGRPETATAEPSGATVREGLYDFPNLLRRLWSVAEQPRVRDVPSDRKPADLPEVRNPPAVAPERREGRPVAPIGRAMPFPAWGPRLPTSSAFRDPPPASLSNASRAPSSPPWNGGSSSTVSGGLSIRNRAWICPGCHAANAPWSTVCPVCRGGTPIA